MKARDYSLDALKGIACILMIFAHGQVADKGILISLAQFIGGLAPILFFAISGVTTTLQTARKKFGEIALFYGIFAVLGLSYSAIWRPNFWATPVCDIFQIITIGVLTVSYLEIYIKPQKIYYLFLSIAAFLIHYIFAQKINLQPFPLIQFFFAGEIAANSFPIFPWVSTFFLGIFAYYVKNSINLLLSIGFGVLLIVFHFLDGGSIKILLDKWNMSVEYFLFSSSLLLILFYGARKYQNIFQNSLLIYLGKSSLLFLYVHLIFRKIFIGIHFERSYLVWISMFLLTCISMKVLQYGNQYIEKYFENYYIWGIMTILVCIIPLVISNSNLIIGMETIIGILFANNYQSLSQLIKQKFASVPTVEKVTSGLR